MFKKKKIIEEHQEGPKPVVVGTSTGRDITVGVHNDPARKVVMESSYSGIPDKDFVFPISAVMTSVVNVDNRGYGLETYKGSIKPSMFWPKKRIGTKPVDVKVLSYSKEVFAVATDAEVHVPGGYVRGTIQADFKFVDGHPESILALLEGSYVKTDSVYERTCRYISAETLEIFIQTILQRIIRDPLNTAEIQNNLKQIQNEIRNEIIDSPYFNDRSLIVSDVSVDFELTSTEKCMDSSIRN